MIGTWLQHVPASRDGKQRRQAAALHIRGALMKLEVHEAAEVRKRYATTGAMPKASATSS